MFFIRSLLARPLKYFFNPSTFVHRHHCSCQARIPSHLDLHITLWPCVFHSSATTHPQAAAHAHPESSLGLQALYVTSLLHILQNRSPLGSSQISYRVAQRPSLAFPSRLTTAPSTLGQPGRPEPSLPCLARLSWSHRPLSLLCLSQPDFPLPSLLRSDVLCPQGWARLFLCAPGLGSPDVPPSFSADASLHASPRTGNSLIFLPDL